jgi:hypothetical protein
MYRGVVLLINKPLIAVQSGTTLRPAPSIHPPQPIIPDQSGIFLCLCPDVSR